MDAGPGGKRYNYYYSETAPVVHDSGAARGDDVMTSITNLRILYRRYDAPKSIIALTVRYLLPAVLRLKLAKNVCPGDLRAMITRARERVNQCNLCWNEAL